LNALSLQIRSEAAHIVRRTQEGDQLFPSTGRAFHALDLECKGVVVDLTRTREIICLKTKAEEMEAVAAASPEAQPGLKAPPRLRDIQNFLLIIGAMKSGTTTLFQYLRQHPEIAPSRLKEPNFFVRDRKRGPRRQRAQYVRLWPDFDPARHRYAMEASTSYTKAPRVSQGVPDRIARFSGRFRCIYIMRNPIDRIESHLAHNLSRGLPVPKIGGSSKRLQHALNVSRYAYQLDQFRSWPGKSEILLLDFDALREDPLAVTAQCAAHLGLDRGFEFTPIEPANVRRPSEAGKTFRLDAKQRSILADLLRDDVAALRDRHGFDVSRWGIL
jgi:hypothetical protein